jgi:outer membrane protein OmpA-like peptidoglycan-associated protein
MRSPLISLFFVAGTVALVGACAKEMPKAAAPPPAPPPPIAAAPAPKAFKVYFDLGKADLSAEDRRIIASAAAEATGNLSARVRLVGKTDTSGSASQNLALSQRRTEAVRDALIGDGVPASRITGESVGETRLEVPTANQVREPRNRVVDIVVGG